jgi:hypothetical protein
MILVFNSDGQTESESFYTIQQAEAYVRDHADIVDSTEDASSSILMEFEDAGGGVWHLEED